METTNSDILPDSDGDNWLVQLDTLDVVDAAEYTIFSRKNELALEGFQVMEDMRRHGKLCDITLKVHDACFTAHRLVLAATIPYFHAMFTLDMVESKKKEVVMKSIEPSALESLINFAYSGKIKIDNDNVQSILVGASFLQLVAVKEACADFLRSSRLHPRNVLGIRAFGETFDCPTLVESCNKFAQTHFVEVADSDEFLNIDYDNFSEIISWDELNVSSESTVFEAAMAWVKHDEEKRCDYLPEILKKIRMPLLSPQYLTDKVSTEALVKRSHNCRDLVDEAKDYHLMPERRPLLQSFKTRPRYCSEIVSLIYAVGGVTTTGESRSTVEVFNPKYGSWELSVSMSMMRSRVGVVVHNDKLYAIGGYDGSDRLATVEVFDVREKCWSKVTSMNCKRSAVGATVLNNRLYVCGGYDGHASLNTVECYDPREGIWRMLNPMNHHRSAAGVVAFDGHVYAVGGHNGHYIYDSVERYDPSSCSWHTVTPMLSKRCRLGATTLDGKLYVCGGYDGSFLRTVEVFDPIISKWSHVASMNGARSRVALVACMGNLYAIGGYDGTNNLSTVEMYHSETDSWSPAASMGVLDGGVGVGVVPCPP